MTEPTAPTPTRADWINTLVGVIDAAFHLHPEEQRAAAAIVGQTLDFLNIPDRGVPRELPATVASEVLRGHYSRSLHGGVAEGSARVVRHVTAADHRASVDSWREALVQMLTIAYPDLDGTEQIGVHRAVNDLLLGIGVPDRAPTTLPDAVVSFERTFARE